MMNAYTNYTLTDGVYQFPGENYVLHVSGVERDRRGRIWASCEIKTTDGIGILAQDRGDMLSGTFRSLLAAQAAKRNSGQPLGIENFLMAAAVALRGDPDMGAVVLVPEFVSAPEFVRNVPPQPRSVVEGLITEGSLTAVGAKPKVGKSVLTMNMAISVATGKGFLGRQVTRGTVFLFQLEDSPWTIKFRLNKMTSGQIPDNLLIHTSEFRLDEENFEATRDACKGAALVILDPIILSVNVKQWNDSTEVRRAYEWWRRLARETGAAVVVNVHHRKSPGSYGDQLGGSIQAQAAVDAMIEIFREEDKFMERTERRVSFTGRDWPDYADEIIDLDPETLIWTSRGAYDDRRAERQDANAQRNSVLVRDALPSEQPGIPMKELEKKTGLKRQTIKVILDDMGDKVGQTGTPQNKSDPTKFYLEEPGPSKPNILL